MAPLFILLSIVLLIWFVYPAYTNGVDGLKEELSRKKVEQDKLDKLMAKKANIEALAADMENNSEKKDVIFKYLPEKNKEEEIIDNLNYLASKEELSIMNLSVGQPIISTATALPEGSGLDENGDPLPVDASGVPIPQAPVKPKALDFQAEFSVVGRYEKMKSLVDKIYKFERFNNFSSLEIKKADETGDSDLLKADMVISFNLYSPVKNTTNIEQIDFSRAKFDLSVADKIKSMKSTSILDLVIDQTGKPNPFMP